MSSQASTPIATTARYGTRLLATVRHRKWPGTALSRENANIIRDAEVTDAIVQNSCAITAMKRMNSAQFSPIAVVQENVRICWPAPTNSSFVAFGSANVTAVRRMNPNSTETATDMTMPHAAPIEACRVSSLM